MLKKLAELLAKRGCLSEGPEGHSEANIQDHAPDLEVSIGIARHSTNSAATARLLELRRLGRGLMASLRGPRRSVQNTQQWTAADPDAVGLSNGPLNAS